MAKYRSSSGYRGVHPFLGTVIHVKDWKASMGGLWVIKKDLMEAGQALYSKAVSRPQQDFFIQTTNLTV